MHIFYIGKLVRGKMLVTCILYDTELYKNESIVNATETCSGQTLYCKIASGTQFSYLYERVSMKVWKMISLYYNESSYGFVIL